MTEKLQHLINGVWHDGEAGPLRSANPARPHETVAEGRHASGEQMLEAITAAQRAFPGWARMPHHDRATVLARTAEVLDAHAEEWGRELTREEGKTLAEGVAELRRAAQIFRFSAAEADRESGAVYASPRAGERILVTHHPLGVISVVTPFNFPAAIPAWKIAPALSYGNTVVWKPASSVPLLAMRLAQALEESGLPPGVLNLVLAEGPNGRLLVEHEGISAVTFTGSTSVGRRIAASCASRGVAVQTEMGGKNAAVVLADADVDLAVAQVMAGAFRSSGQKCTATSRLVVVEAVADEVVKEVARRAEALEVGDPTSAGVAMGPLISDAARREVLAGIRSAIDAGGTVLAGGEPYREGELADGYFVPPTVVELPSTDLDLWREELFGPVLAVVRAADADEAFALANDSRFGLSGAVFTGDLGSALSAIDRVDVGVLHINSETAGADPHVPFGGVRASGFGPKEQGRAARDFFTRSTTVYLRAAG